MLNETHLFVAAGRTTSGSYTTNNYLFEINAEQRTQIADRTYAAYAWHKSGTFYNSTVDEMQIANIGVNGIEVYSPRDDSWHQLPFPPPLTSLQRSAAIQQGTDSFILIGGMTNMNDYSGDIFLFDNNGFSILKENVLQVGRNLHVAMPISMEDFSCG